MNRRSILAFDHIYRIKILKILFFNPKLHVFFAYFTCIFLINRAICHKQVNKKKFMSHIAHHLSKNSKNEIRFMESYTRQLFSNLFSRKSNVCYNALFVTERFCSPFSFWTLQLSKWSLTTVNKLDINLQ